MFVTKDSGVRQHYATGARRDTQSGKGRYDLIPPEALRRLAQLYERGAAKYGDRNWEVGIPVSRCFSSALRHLMQALASEADEDHLAAVLFNVAAIITYRERIAAGLLPDSIDDVYPAGAAPLPVEPENTTGSSSTTPLASEDDINLGPVS